MGDEETQNRESTTVDALEASLGDLLKAAGATDVADTLLKGGKGTVEGGRGNNFADEGDAGPLEHMMIGKMHQMGLSGDQINELTGYMRGKAGFVPINRPSAKGKMRGYADQDFGGDDDGDGDEDEDEDDDEDDGPPVGKRRGRSQAAMPFAKSFSEQFADDDDISKAVDVSPFLEALTARTSDALDSIAKAMRTSGKRQDKMNKATAIALTQMGMIVKSQQAVIGELGRRLGVVEATPLPPRGVTAPGQGGRPLAKSMPGEQGAPNTQLNKSQIVSTLSYMNIEKSMREIGGSKTSDLIVKAEAGNIVPESVLKAVHTFLATHPGEREVALNYQ